MTTFKLFLTHTYLTAAGWFGVYDLLDPRGFCHGSKIIPADTREQLMDLHNESCEC